MEQYNSKLKEYQALNKLAEAGGMVLFGGGDDWRIPVSELKQSFSLQISCYNRSFEKLQIGDAPALFEVAAEALDPESIILHIGMNDEARFAEDADGFLEDYRTLLWQIKGNHNKCRIAIVSIDNPEKKEWITQMNHQLKCLADSEQCEFHDIAIRKNWNPQATKEVVSFVYSMGFVRPLKVKKSLYDLVKILYGYQAAYLL